MPQDPPIVDAFKSALIKHVDRRRFGPVRWIRKVREVREYGAPVRENLRYVLTDPELDNYSYDLANDAKVGEWLEQVFGIADGRAAIAEARGDARLRARIDAACAKRRWTMSSGPGSAGDSTASGTNTSSSTRRRRRAFRCCSRTTARSRRRWPTSAASAAAATASSARCRKDHFYPGAGIGAGIFS